MQHFRIPELAHRDRFIRKAVGQRNVYVVAGEDGLARVTSPADPKREVTLMWTSEEEAARWADVLTANPRVKPIDIGGLVSDVLPKLASLSRTVGLDWSSEPLEVEIDPLDLAARMRQEGVEIFLQRARLRRTVWTLEDANGPALLVSQRSETQLVLPCWATRAEAETRIEGPWADMLAAEIPLDNFVALTLPWIAEQGWLVAPGHAEGASSVELSANELARRIAPGARTG